MTVLHMYALLRIRWSIHGDSVIFFFIIIKLNSIVLQISLQHKYNIDVLTVNIEFMWLGMKRMEKLAIARFCFSIV